MREATSWSLNLGTWGGVRLRLHASLVVVAVLALYVGTRVRPPEDHSAAGLLGFGILLLSLLWHEMAHSAAAARMGGGVELVILGPLGSLTRPHVPFDRRREFLVAAAGPLASFALAAAATAAIAAQGEPMREIFRQPFHPSGLLDGTIGMVGLKLACWINWILFLANLMPAAPLDGGWALRSLLCLVMDYPSAAKVVSRSGMLMAAGLWLLALLERDSHAYRLIPVWLPLTLLGVYLFFASLQAAHRLEHDDFDDGLLDYEFAETYAHLDERPHRPHGPGLLRRWWQQRREQKLQRMREIEEEEELLADDVLIRVKQYGIDAISREERALLQRVSARYRNRLRS